MRELLKKWFPKIFDKDRLQLEKFEEMDRNVRFSNRQTALIIKPGATDKDPRPYVDRRLNEIREKYPLGWTIWCGVHMIHYCDSKNPEWDYWIVYGDIEKELNAYEVQMKESHEMVESWNLKKLKS